MRIVRSTFVLVAIAFSLIALFLFATGVDAQRKFTPVPTPTPTIAPVNSYELFWPITAGKVMGEPLYYLKSLKEDLREILIFSELKKADYNVTLSEKRTVEAEKLFLAFKDYGNADKTLNLAQEKRQKALDLVKRAEDKGRYVADLKNRMIRSLENQRALLHYVANQVPEEQKSVIDESVANLNSLLATLQ